jgi:predicted RNA-binding protein
MRDVAAVEVMEEEVRIFDPLETYQRLMKQKRSEQKN